MNNVDFIWKIRLGICSGAYNIKEVVKKLHENGYQTTLCVPEEKRAGFLTLLSEPATDQF